MTEEMVTKRILEWLINNRWKIVCFDFPQSGTGRIIHPNKSRDKTLGTFNPDIVAVRDGVCLFFENKNRFYKPDFYKVNQLIENNQYTDGISKLLGKEQVSAIYYGIGLPGNSNFFKVSQFLYLVDFLVCVDNNHVEVKYNPKNIYM